ncbi:MAG: hypothetical protein ACPGC0_02105 [Opitutales bacterium]
MELLNLSFAILIIKLSISVLPIVLGSYIMLAPEEIKRDMRGFICRSLFNVNNAIPMRDFNRILYGVGGLGVLLGLVAGWILVLKPFLA